MFLYPREYSTDLNLLNYNKLLENDAIFTNGPLKNREIFLKSCQELGIRTLIFSLHGNEKSYCKLTGNSLASYRLILKNIKTVLRKNFRVEVFHAVTHFNVNQVEKFIEKCNELRINRIRFIRLFPAGNAERLPDEYFLTKDDFYKFIEKIELIKLKRLSHYTRLGISYTFGPNFYSKPFRNFLSGKITLAWPKSKFGCPVINNQLIAIDLFSDNIYWCFFLQSLSEAIIGKLKFRKDKPIFDVKFPKFDEATLSKNLDGICSKNYCRFHKQCLGGCRAMAYLFARKNNHKNPIYAGMDMCYTKAIEDLGIYKKL